MAKLNYRRELTHSGLNKYKVIKAETFRELEQKCAAIQAQWDEQWQKKCAAEKEKELRDRERYNVENAIKYAEKQTIQAENKISEIENLLKNKIKILTVQNAYDWSSYGIEKPKPKPMVAYPIEPKRTELKYNPPKSFFDIFNKNGYIETNDKKFNFDYNLWKEKTIEIENINNQNKIEYEKKLKQWEKDKEEFDAEKNTYNKNIDDIFVQYNAGEKNGIENFYSLLFSEIKLPIVYNAEVEFEYFNDNKMLVLELTLPNIDDLPKLKKITYVKSSKNYKETYQTEAFMKKLYDKAIYDVVLFYLNEVFVNDKLNYISAVVFNGKVNTIDKTTGNEISPYILSINISKETFGELNIEHIDSKEWFKSSKGVSASTFAKVTPVAPVIKINREDSRFIEGYDVVDDIDESVNLAAIDWQDFENLIREVFAEEFKSNGGEVKITQASRDGGVDAVAFDPDPIRGGKIVIQAKRYTNVVGVSAVRDLYGTVMNEGAIKGILVTTSNYGSDAYEFAKGKPLTLMNGANLLYLLEKHGHKAKIDLAEAKKILKG